MTKKVKFIKMVPGFYAADSTHEINSVVAERFVKMGIAREVKDESEPARPITRNKAVKKII